MEQKRGATSALHTPEPDLREPSGLITDTLMFLTRAVGITAHLNTDINTTLMAGERVGRAFALQTGFHLQHLVRLLSTHQSDS